MLKFKKHLKLSNLKICKICKKNFKMRRDMYIREKLGSMYLLTLTNSCLKGILAFKGKFYILKSKKNIIFLSQET